MKTTQARTRHRVVVDNRELARQIGGRIRAARLAARLTQQELAGDRYTKAYISALELGHAKPSMAALDYLAPRLGTAPDRLLADDAGHWSRVDADLHLASGRFAEALDAYQGLAERQVESVVRGELLLGAAEACCRLNRPQDASQLLAEARRRLDGGGRTADLKRAQYWQAWVHMTLDDPEEARRLLLDLLGSDAADAEDADFAVRVRIALAQVETEHGLPERARLYLDEARDLAGELDLRRRAVYLDVLARARSSVGDHEAAIRLGSEALALYRTCDLETQEAGLQNQMAMTFHALGNLARADEFACGAIATAERLGAQHDLGHYLDTRATILLEQGDPTAALALVDRALALEAQHGPANDQVGARITRARALGALQRPAEADAAWAAAGAAARSLVSPTRRKRVFAAWAEWLAEQDRHADAYAVMREAI